MRYFKDLTKSGDLICIWKSKDDIEINNRVDCTTREIDEKEHNMLLNEINNKTNIYEKEIW